MSEKPQILLAVDNFQSARPLRELLEGAGYATEWRPFNEARLCSPMRPPDLWILDTLMMDEEEMRAFHAIRHRAGWEDVPVLAIATILDSESRQKIRLLGADEIIAKPIDRAEVMVKVKSLLRLRSIEAQAKKAESTAEIKENALADPIANLRRIAATQSSKQSLETILVQLLRYVRHHVEYDEAFICAETESSRYGVVAYIGGGTCDLPPFYEPGDSYTGWLVLHKKPLLVRDVDNDSRASLHGRERGLNGAINSFAGVPLLREGHVIGTLEFATYRRGAFRDEILEVLRPVADVAALAIEHARLRNDVALQADLLSQELTRFREQAKMIFQAPALERIIKAAYKAKDSQCSVLVTGETGTGKELIARYIHWESNRRRFPFVDLNCAAIPEALQESELFGIENKIATGVEKHIGKFEAVGNGVLFLDEVAYMPLSMQSKMLRVLQERTFERVGGHRKHEFGGRVLAATSCDITQAIREKSFREELYYRLAVVHLHLPPLRERREDIPYLVRHFVQQVCTETKRPLLGISAETMAAFVNGNWPGNVRQLRNAVERSVLFSSGEELEVSDDVFAAYPSVPEANRSSLILKAAFEERLSVPELVNRYSRYVFDRMGGNKARACEYLQINYRTLRKRLEEPSVSPAPPVKSASQEPGVQQSAADD
jgi:DNA-binding NtrC family response regulator